MPDVDNVMHSSHFGGLVEVANNGVEVFLSANGHIVDDPSFTTIGTAQVQLPVPFAANHIQHVSLHGFGFFGESLDRVRVYVDTVLVHDSGVIVGQSGTDLFYESPLSIKTTGGRIQVSVVISGAPFILAGMGGQITSVGCPN